ncbi:hypothetical protein B0H14DRAFT_3887794 [Mycena olivaceomarginata]|nr:hypothetical protein B0H14DRAFT_3887794 [Mycena olivaceomarginata]
MNRTAINYGVEEYIDYGPAKDFFACFDVPTQPIVQFAANTIYADAATGTLLPNITVPQSQNNSLPCRPTSPSWSSTPPTLLPGDWNFSPSDAIPANVLLPWAEFEANKKNRETSEDELKGGTRRCSTSQTSPMDHRLLMKAVAEEYRAGKSELPILYRARSAPALWAHPQRPIVPVPPPAVACTSIRVPLSWSPSSTVPPRIDTHERSPSTSSTTTLTVHGTHSSYSYSCTAVAHQQSGLLDRSPARRSPRAVGWHRICGSVWGEACAHNTPHSATSGGASHVAANDHGVGDAAWTASGACTTMVFRPAAHTRDIDVAGTEKPHATE